MKKAEQLVSTLSHDATSQFQLLRGDITNPKPVTNYDILSIIKKALDFNKLEIIENACYERLTDEEEHLNDMISVFNDYLSRLFKFDDTHTQNLIKDFKIKHLDIYDENIK